MRSPMRTVGATVPVGAALAATALQPGNAVLAQGRFLEGQPVLGQARAFDPFGKRVAVLPDVHCDGICDVTALEQHGRRRLPTQDEPSPAIAGEGRVGCITGFTRSSIAGKK